MIQPGLTGWAQVRYPYGASVEDAWMDVELEAMTKVWQGLGGESNFFFSEEDAREARGAYVGTQPYEFAETLWRLAQVSPSQKYGYRSAIVEFVTCGSPLASTKMPG